MESKIPARSFTVIIRDDAPLICVGDTPIYRRVSLDFTTHQMEKMRVYQTATSGGKPIFESLSKIFWEE
jgi:hypothetical protein